MLKLGSPSSNLALRPVVVAKSSTSFGWGKGGNFTSVGWQVTLRDPIWHVSSRSGEGGLLTRANGYTAFTYSTSGTPKHLIHLPVCFRAITFKRNDVEL